MKRAFSLVELLTCIAILVLLAGLLFPVFSSAKRKGYQGSCTEQLRQVGMAVLQYSEDTGGLPREWGLDSLVDGGYLREPSMLRCHEDPISGFGTAYRTCEMSHQMRLRSSFNTAFDPNHILWDLLTKVDKNPGMVACRLHGNKTSYFSDIFGAKRCHALPFAYEGTTLRVRHDGSLKTFTYRFKPASDGVSSGFSFRYGFLFTDTEYDPERM